MSLLVGAVKVYAYALEKTPPIMTTVRLFLHKVVLRALVDRK